MSPTVDARQARLARIIEIIGHAATDADALAQVMQEFSIQRQRASQLIAQARRRQRWESLRESQKKLMQKKHDEKMTISQALNLAKTLIEKVPSRINITKALVTGIIPGYQDESGRWYASRADFMTWIMAQRKSGRPLEAGRSRCRVCRALRPERLMRDGACTDKRRCLRRAGKKQPE